MIHGRILIVVELGPGSRPSFFCFLFFLTCSPTLGIWTLPRTSLFCSLEPDRARFTQNARPHRAGVERKRNELRESPSLPRLAEGPVCTCSRGKGRKTRTRPWIDQRIKLSFIHIDTSQPKKKPYHVLSVCCICLFAPFGPVKAGNQSFLF